MKNQYILMVVFGNGDFKEEAVYSLTSLFSYDVKSKIILASDDVLYFKNHFRYLDIKDKIIYEQISQQQLDVWAGESGFIFRIKINAIMYCIEKYNADIVYIDSDTVCIKNIDFLTLCAEDNLFLYSTGISLYDEQRMIQRAMEQEEIDSSYLRFLTIKDRLYRHLMKGIHVDSFDFQIQSSFVFRNAGVVGIPFFQRDLLPIVLKLSDYLYSEYHYELSEELAFNIVFSRQSNYIDVKSNEYIYHYSSQETKFCRLLIGYVGNCLSDSDVTILHDMLNFLGIDAFEQFELSYADIPIFMSFLVSFTNIGEFGTKGEKQRFLLEKDYLPNNKDRLKDVKKYMKIYIMQRENHHVHRDG